jgi:tRNA pseudouridine38-40 synthase
MQNFFHFDAQINVDAKSTYKLNAILPADISVKGVYKVKSNDHCRFNAISREYNYFIYCKKNPFIRETAYYYPYKINFEILQQAAELIKGYKDFSSFSKRNTQVQTFLCRVNESAWYYKDECLIYKIVANRFLRGMVRGLVATMLKAARGTISVSEFIEIVENKNSLHADFSAPPHGLFLSKVNYPQNFFDS